MWRQAAIVKVILEVESRVVMEVEERGSGASDCGDGGKKIELG